MDGNYYKKPYEDQFAFHAMTSEAPIGQAYTTDEAIPILDLDTSDHRQGYYNYQMMFDEAASRRISGSSFSISTSDMVHDDFTTAMSDAPSYCSDYPPTSNRDSWMSSTHLSPVASPRMSAQGRSDLVRAQSRGRASPSPRPSVRSAPYNVDVPRNNKRWSTGSYGNPSNRRPMHTPLMYNPGPETHAAHHRMSRALADPRGNGTLNSASTTTQPHYLMPSQPVLQRNSMLLPTQLPSQLASQHTLGEGRHFDAAPPPLLSHGLLRMLQSNVDSHPLRRYADLSDPPDLFSCLHEEQLSPPEEDMNPSDPDMMPREQDLRFEGDLYTPRWVRGHGNKREGWCGICKPGRWLVLKNSAYWYDKSFSHGISAATGSPFQEPLDMRRMDGNPDVWEGLCSSCNDWVALVSSKKKGTTWFRHAYKCHSHPKAKDSAKRRRENASARSSMPVKASKTDKLSSPAHLNSSNNFNDNGTGPPAMPTHLPPPPPLLSESYPNMI
ncbi:Meiotic expression up-regulated protein-like protein [Emericellopsis cladophorae]|uniref:Meiotic expression up-regulated protein-like protein n=1 Tax=Emericellopsis cladophorae TaxID=2686198 RepID=A0A9Q0BFF6_9HYPO|nr:Meiotic expression up-regulated protein-like protein [Emericellopsis cladophorae]KAI6783932.1 Meiotic expression up-regulated protein-like protein [Emericellopsis cladophorae]